MDGNVELLSFDDMGLREDLIRGIYAYGKHTMIMFFLQLFDNEVCRI